MTFKYADRVKEATTSTGTGTITLAGAATNFKAFSDVLSVADTTVYAIVDDTNNTWEVGVGTLATTSTLARTTILASSSGGAAVAFAAGTKSVYITTSGARGLLVPEAGGTATTGDALEIFQRNAGGRRMLAMVGPAGLDTVVQPSIARNKVSTWNPTGNATTITSFSTAALTATGTATTANVATTNIHTYQKRVDFLVTVATTTAVAGWRNAVAQYTIGASTAGLGGFHFIFRFGLATGVTTATKRCFVGMSSSTAAPTDVNPSTITNSVGFGYDAADTNIQFMYRGAGASVKVDTGIAIPTTGDRTHAYELVMFSPPGTTQSLGYLITNLGTGVSFGGTITTGLPANTTLLAPRGWTSVGGTSSVTGIALMSGYIESDY